MKFRIASDLHLEHRLPQAASVEEEMPVILEQVLPSDDQDSESTMILAGDITSYPDQRAALIKVLLERFKGVFYIPGNHEHWGGNLFEWSIERAVLMDGHHPTRVCVGDIQRTVGWTQKDVQLIGCTLWTDFAKDNPSIQLALRDWVDFKMIGPDQYGVKFDQSSARAIHAICVDSIQYFLEFGQIRNVSSIVVTHHLPSFSLCDPRFKQCVEDHAFASDLNHLLAGPNAPKYWIHGHTHVRIDRRLGDTQVICNPCGYPGQDTGYEPRLFLEV